MCLTLGVFPRSPLEHTETHRNGLSLQPGQPMLFPWQVQISYTHTHSTLMPKHVAMLVEAAGFLIQLPMVTPPHMVGASSAGTHRRPFSSRAVMLGINQRRRLLPLRPAARGAGATSASPPLPALHHAVAFPSSRLPLAAPGRAEELQQKRSQRGGPAATARLGVPPPHTLLQPLQGGFPGAPTSEPAPWAVPHVSSARVHAGDTNSPWGGLMRGRVIEGDAYLLQSWPCPLAPGGFCVSCDGPFGSPA